MVYISEEGQFGFLQLCAPLLKPLRCHTAATQLSHNVTHYSILTEWEEPALNLVHYVTVVRC